MFYVTTGRDRTEAVLKSQTRLVQRERPKYFFKIHRFLVFPHFPNHIQSMEIALHWPDGQFIAFVPEHEIRARISRKEVTIVRTRKERRAVVRESSKFSDDLQSYGSTEKNGDAGNFTAHYTEQVGGGHELKVLKKCRDGRLIKWRNEDKSNPKRKFDRFTCSTSMFANLERRITKLFPPVGIQA